MRVLIHYSLNCTCQLSILIMCLTIVNPKNIQCRKSLRKFKHAYLAFKHTYLNTLFKKKWKACVTITYCVVCVSICSKNKKQNQEGWTRREHKGQYINTSLTGTPRICNRERVISSVNGAGKLDIYMQKDETGPLFYTTPKH